MLRRFCIISFIETDVLCLLYSRSFLLSSTLTSVLYRKIGGNPPNGTSPVSYPSCDSNLLSSPLSFGIFLFK